MESKFLSDETVGIAKREEINPFMTQGNTFTEYDLSWHDKNRILSAEDRKNFKNVLSSVTTTGYRKPQTAIIGTDEENYKSDDAILQELKRESVQHFIGRSTSLEEQRLDRFADVIGAEEQEKSEAEKAAINDRLVKKSSHRWNKTKRKKLKKSREIMGTAIDKINELQKSDTIEKSDNLGAIEIAKDDYKNKFNKYNEIYAAIYQSDCHLAEAVAKNEREEIGIKAKAKKTFFVNMYNVVERERLCYEEENIRIMEEANNQNIGKPDRGKYSSFAERIAKVHERITFYQAKKGEISEKLHDAEEEIRKLGIAATSMDEVIATYDNVSDTEMAEILEEETEKKFDQWREEIRNNRLKPSDWEGIS